jgi:hypothetical protein
MGDLLLDCAEGELSTEPAAVPGSPVPAPAVPRLRAITDQLAKENGGVVPSWISAVVTTQEKAQTSATPGAVSPTGGKTVVYLVAMKGHFKRDRGLRLLGPQAPEHQAHAPALNYQSVVVSAKTLRVTAWRLSPDPPPVAPSSLGRVTWLKR